MNDDDRQAIERLLTESDPAAGVVFLPESFDEDGKGIYDDALILLSKLLRSEGIAVSWAQEASERTYIARRSAAEVIWNAGLSLPIAVGAGLAVAKLSQWLGLSPQREGKVRFFLARAKGPDGISWEWQEIEGTGAEVAELMKGLAPPVPDLPTAPTSNPPALPPTEPPLVPPS
ncbi:hypothetical protein [Mycobacterium sp. 852002-51057_SCH5723018]|uniref:hypothetical protein n=1 Tax=Mycobacterium sp. 852002-51057_SCH5723018 TaxID=1834094 RepID=UPI0012E8E976|nr:hypothetical protein [Mycobacterium sp. 852002-51057_SCH5723018]